MSSVLYKLALIYVLVNTFLKNEVFFLIKYKFDIIDALNAAGYYRQKIKDGKLISQGSLTRIKRGEPVSIDTIDTICRLLSCQPGDLLEYVPD